MDTANLWEGGKDQTESAYRGKSLVGAGGDEFVSVGEDSEGRHSLWFESPGQSSPFVCEPPLCSRSHFFLAMCNTFKCCIIMMSLDQSIIWVVFLLIVLVYIRDNSYSDNISVAVTNLQKHWYALRIFFPPQQSLNVCFEFYWEN